MSLKFFGLPEQPFGLSPSPRYFYAARSHREALESLLYGIENGMGFLGLIAQPGMGKTSVFSTLVQRLPASIRTAIITSSQVGPHKFLPALLAGMEIDISEADGDFEMQEKLREVLVGEAAAGRRVLVLIDEAQHLDVAALETMRLAANVETSGSKLMSIILAGQPSLADKLARPELVQLAQRISIVAHLSPLNEAETKEYIDYRLRTAGYRDGPLFTPEAYSIIATRSRGVPRDINSLCNGALSLGYSSGCRTIDRRIVADASPHPELSTFEEQLPRPRQANHREESGVEEDREAGALVCGKYQILDRLGEGTIAFVYKARDVYSGYTCAIKLMRKEPANDASLVQLFREQATIARHLEHPNVGQVEEIDQTEDGIPFLVMEYVDGHPLKAAMKGTPRMPVKRVCAIASQVAAALAAAHKLGMVHRDLNPENIVLVQTPEGEVAKVLNFGYATVKEAGNSGIKTQTMLGWVFGNPSYLSPEQAASKRVDGRADLYSLGVTMYEALTGFLPLTSKTPLGMVLAQVFNQPTEIRQWRFGLPESLARLIMSCLEKDPGLRPQTGEEFARALDLAVEELDRGTISAELPSAVIPGWPPVVAPHGVSAVAPQPNTTTPAGGNQPDAPPTSHPGRAASAVQVVNFPTVEDAPQPDEPLTCPAESPRETGENLRDDVYVSRSPAKPAASHPVLWAAFGMGLLSVAVFLLAGRIRAPKPFSQTVRALTAQGKPVAIPEPISTSVGILTGPVLSGGTVNKFYRQELAAGGGSPPYTWSITRGAVPGIMLDGTKGLLSGAPTASKQYQLEIKVTDARGVSKTKVLNLHVLQDGILIAADGERDAPLGRLFNHTFTATGGAGAYKWSTQRGGVPGLHLDSATGTLSGTPTAEGKFQLAVEARDQNGAWVVHSFYLNVHRVVAADGPPVASPEASQTRAGNQDTRKFETAPSAPPYTLPMLVKGSPSPVHEQVNLEKLPLPAARSLLIPPATPLVSVSLPEFVLDRTLDGHSGWVTGLAFTADGRRLAASRSDQTVKFWDVATGQELGSVGSDMKGIQALAFSHDGHFLAAESTSDDVALWDAATGRELRTLPGSGRSGFLDSGSWVYSIAFSPDGRWLASGEDDRTVRLWEVKTGRPAHDLAGLRRPVICMAFSPDGRWLATGDGDKTIGIWDVAIGREIRKLRGHTKDVYAVAFSPDGRWLASASGDKCVKLWDFSSGREVYTLTSHRNSVTSLAFSPDSRWLASGSWDKTVKIWDSTTGGVVQTLTGHTNHVYAIAVDSSGRWLASGSEDGTIKLWRLREPQLKN